MLVCRARLQPCRKRPPIVGFSRCGTCGSAVAGFTLVGSAIPQVGTVPSSHRGNTKPIVLAKCKAISSIAPRCCHFSLDPTWSLCQDDEPKKVSAFPQPSRCKLVHVFVGRAGLNQARFSNAWTLCFSPEKYPLAKRGWRSFVFSCLLQLTFPAGIRSQRNSVLRQPADTLVNQSSPFTLQSSPASGHDLDVLPPQPAAEKMLLGLDLIRLNRRTLLRIVIAGLVISAAIAFLIPKAI